MAAKTATLAAISRMAWAEETAGVGTAGIGVDGTGAGLGGSGGSAIAMRKDLCGPRDGRSDTTAAGGLPGARILQGSGAQTAPASAGAAAPGGPAAPRLCRSSSGIFVGLYYPKGLVISAGG